MHKDELLVKGLSPPPLKDKIEIRRNIDTLCAITGKHISSGVRTRDIVTYATNQPHESFKYFSDYVSLDSARMFKWVIGGAVGNMFASEEFGCKPMVSRKSATKQSRYCWIDLIRTLKPGTETFCIFTQEAKRRLWPFAQTGTVGPLWNIYLNAGDTAANVIIDFAKLLKCLDLCEELYTLGFSKAQLQESLYSLKSVRAFGFDTVSQHETHLSRWRGTNEFKLSIFIVQKKEINRNDYN